MVEQRSPKPLARVRFLVPPHLVGVVIALPMPIDFLLEKWENPAV